MGPPLLPFCAAAKSGVAVMTAIMATKAYFSICCSSVVARQSIGFRRGERCSVFGQQPVQRLPAEHQKEDRGHDGIQYCGAEQAAEDRNGHRMEDFPSRFICADEKRSQRQSSAKRRHQNGAEPLHATANDQTRSEALAFVNGKIDVVGNLENSISCRNSCKCYVS